MFIAPALCILFMACGSPQRALISTIEKCSDKSDSKDSILLPIQKNNDLVIGYSTSFPGWSDGGSYYLHALKVKEWKAYRYIQKDIVEVGEKFYSLDSFTISKELGGSILRLFKKNKGWEIRSQTSRSGCPHIDKNKGHCIVDDGGSEHLIIITKNYHNTAKFEAPDSYEGCCPGWKTRQQYMEIREPIKKLFKERR